MKVLSIAYKMLCKLVAHRPFENWYFFWQNFHPIPIPVQGRLNGEAWKKIVKLYIYIYNTFLYLVLLKVLYLLIYYLENFFFLELYIQL